MGAVPKVLQEWRTKFAEYRNQGLSKSEAYEKIGKEYDCSKETARYWLDPGRREYEISKTTAYHKANANSPRYRSHKRHSANVRRHIDAHVAEAFHEANQPLSITEIAAKIHRNTGISFGEHTLERLCQSYTARTGTQLLVQTDDSTRRYSLASSR